ncbi:MAG TPA: response regulator [Gaiellaceae bacterium]|jgi:CheY-like chemotaxis protein
MKVLLVDDNNIVRALAREMLESAGYDVVEANGLGNALDRARELGEVEVLVTDLVMPDGDGLDVATSVARLSPNVRVLYTSAYADMRWTGSFVPKPYTSAELVEALDRLIKH